MAKLCMALRGRRGAKRDGKFAVRQEGENLGPHGGITLGIRMFFETGGAN
jgi:hypothetical protein